MSMPVQKRATLDDLYRVTDKAELINGRIVYLMPHGRRPALIAKQILLSLDPYVASLGLGEVHMDNLGYAIRPPLPSGRQSFSPDTSYYVGPFPPNTMRFIEGAPTFAVEVRSENDYGPAADLEIAAKRSDYFQAGTIVVWDVDSKAEMVASYRASDPTNGITFRRGDIADAEPAVPGWRMPVDAIFG